MEKLVHPTQGTRYIGIANFSPKMVDNLLKNATVIPKVHQFESHPYLQQSAFVDFHFKRNISVMNYAPLGNTGPHYSWSGSGAPKLLENDLIVDIAKSRKCTPAQVVLAWALSRKTIIIPKAMRLDHQKENIETLKDCNLQESDIARIQSIQQNVRMLTYPCAPAGWVCYEGLTCRDCI
jgi:alcohol dehydrogenase (NADP+)